MSGRIEETVLAEWKRITALPDTFGKLELLVPLGFGEAAATAALREFVAELEREVDINDAGSGIIPTSVLDDVKRKWLP